MTDARVEAPAWWSTDEWATPQEEVDRFEQEFGVFALDPCATASNARGEAYYDQEMNGLAQAWFGRVWLNMPYSDPGPWLQKAVQEWQAGRVELIVACLPAATDTAWFHDWVLPYAELRFRRGRIRFLDWTGRPRGTPKAGTIYAVYRRKDLP